MPEISVLLPALNAESSIAQAVSSTLRAMPSDAELLVLDDGSSDATAERAARAAESVGRGKDLRILRNEAPRGVAAGLNRLLRESDSRLVGRMDADDVSLPGRFAACRRAIARGDDFVFTQVVKKQGWRVRPNPPVRITPAGFALELLVTNPVAHSTMLARREAMMDLGGYRQVPAEDYDMWLRAASAGMRLRRLARWGLIYRVHPGQLTGTKGWFGQSWRDPAQAQAFADLATRLVGQPLKRLVAIAALPEADRARELSRFEKLVTPAVAKVPGAHGLLLRRRLRARIAWVPAAAQNTNRAETQRREQR